MFFFLYQEFHLHRKNCIRKTPPREIGSSPSPERKSIYNGDGSISPLKQPIVTTSNQSSDNEYTCMSQQSSDAQSCPSPEKPLTPGGSLDTEQLFRNMLLAPSASPTFPPFPLSASSPLHNTSTLSPDDVTPVDSPKLPRATSSEALDDVASLPPADDALIIVEDLVTVVDDPIIIPAPPEFSECSQVSNVSGSDSGTFQLTASGSMQAVQDVISAMEQHIAQSPMEPVCNDKLQAAQPCMQNIATVGMGSEQTPQYSSSNDSQRAAVASYAPSSPTADSSKAKITYDPSSSEIKITVPAQSITPNEGHAALPNVGVLQQNKVLKHAQTFDSTPTPDAESTPKASRAPQSRVHQLAREFSKKIRKDVEVPQDTSEVSKDNPPWLKRLKQKKPGSIGAESDDSDSSPKPQKQPAKLIRQKSLTLSRFNSTKDVAAVVTDTAAETSKGNASVPSKRKAFTLGSSSVMSEMDSAIQISDKSVTLPKVHSASSPKVKSMPSPIVTPFSNVTLAPQARTSSPTSLPKVSSSLQMHATPVTAPNSEIPPSENGSEEMNGAGPVANDDESSTRKKSVKQKSTTLHRLSAVDPLSGGSNMQRAVSEASLTQGASNTEVEPQQKQRFKGWVKSLVDKFSTK